MKLLYYTIGMFNCLPIYHIIHLYLYTYFLTGVRKNHTRYYTTIQIYIMVYGTVPQHPIRRNT